MNSIRSSLTRGINPRLKTLFCFSAYLLLAFITTFAQQPELVIQTGHSHLISLVAFSSDNKILASSSYDKMIKLWDVATGREMRTLKGHAEAVSSVAIMPDAKTLASGSFDKTIKLWDVATGRELRTLTGHSAAVKRIAIISDGKLLASGSYDRTIKLLGHQYRSRTTYSQRAFRFDFLYLH